MNPSLKLNVWDIVRISVINLIIFALYLVECFSFSFYNVEAEEDYNKNINTTKNEEGRKETIGTNHERYTKAY